MHALPNSRKMRMVLFATVAALVSALAPLAAPPATAAPPDVVADSPAEYGLCGRVFPDPMAFAPSPQALPGESPWAKGNAACRAGEFISHDAALRGLNFLEDLFPRFVEVIDLTDSEFDAVLDRELGDGQTAGLPDEELVRKRSNLTMVKVTDKESRVAEAKREHFVFPLSIHGIERAGIEGGLRAVEDLATWGANEPNRPILETVKDPAQLPAGTRNKPVGEVLEQSVSYFLLANPDGWIRGDKDAGNSAFMRYNGNGMDMNRDWPTIGWTNTGFTPWSEPETRSFGKVLKAIKPQWSGGIDLHGQIIDRAFSFTLLGGSQRPYDKNERTMQFVEAAYEDASKRLSWSKIVKPNDGLPGCVDSNNVNPEVNPPPCDPRVYGVQYGTIYDSISYTVTGDFGSWIDSPLGLNGDGIDNEMSLSHLGNCGTGNCFIAEAEQLHVDGNKSLIYGMLNFRSQEPDSTFAFAGKAGYLVNPRRLVDAGISAPKAPKGTRPQETIHKVFTQTNGSQTHEFDVKGPDQGFYNGGISAQITFTNVRGQTRGTAPSVALQRKDEQGAWQNVGGGASADPAYANAGRKIDYNYPQPGRYRINVSGTPGQADVVVDFTKAPAWPDPIQAAVNVSNMDFFRDLRPFAGSSKLLPLSVDDVLAGSVDVAQFDTIIATDDAFLPGYQPTSPTKGKLNPTRYTDADRDAMAQKMRAFADGGGNLVLTDDSVRALEWMGITPAGSVTKEGTYVGHVAFTTDGGTNTTYNDPLAKNMNPSGSSEGPGRRKQIVEPVPLGYNLSNTVPQWRVANAAITGAGGRIIGTEQNDDLATLAEIPVGAGRVRIAGSFLPWPTTEFAHNYGLSSYAITFNGYELAKNLFSWERP